MLVQETANLLLRGLLYGRVENCLEEQAIGEYVWESREVLGGAGYR